MHLKHNSFIGTFQGNVLPHTKNKLLPLMLHPLFWAFQFPLVVLHYSCFLPHLACFVTRLHPVMHIWRFWFEASGFLRPGSFRNHKIPPEVDGTFHVLPLARSDSRGRREGKILAYNLCRIRLYVPQTKQSLNLSRNAGPNPLNLARNSETVSRVLSDC